MGLRPGYNQRHGICLVDVYGSRSLACAGYADGDGGRPGDRQPAVHFRVVKQAPETKQIIRPPRRDCGKFDVAQTKYSVDDPDLSILYTSSVGIILILNPLYFIRCLRSFTDA